MERPTSIPRHPIRVVSQRTGLTPATIRAWERRYEAVRPGRSEGGQRLYTDEEVERLSMLRRLTEMGRSISMVADLSDPEARELLEEDLRATVPPATENGHAAPAIVRRAYEDIVALDAEDLELTLWRAAVSLEGRAFLEDVVSPLLKKIGDGWEAGEVDPGQEHLGSDVVDRMLSRVADPAGNSGPILVVATLPGERHGLGARLVAAAATVDGWSATYLGTDLPVKDIAGAALSLGARAVAISVVGRQDLPGATRALRQLRQLLEPSMDLLVGGGAAPLLISDELPRNVLVLDGLEGLRALHPSRR